MAQNAWMDIDEFVESGLLQEVNRRVLHPLGLALTVSFHVGDVFVGLGDGMGVKTVDRQKPRASIEGILDFRAKPGGEAFRAPSTAKAVSVAAMEAAQRPKRKAVRGYWIEPVEGVEDPTTRADRLADELVAARAEASDAAARVRAEHADQTASYLRQIQALSDRIEALEAAVEEAKASGASSRATTDDVRIAEAPGGTGSSLPARRLRVGEIVVTGPTGIQYAGALRYSLLAITAAGYKLDGTRFWWAPPECAPVEILDLGQIDWIDLPPHLVEARENPDGPPGAMIFEVDYGRGRGRAALRGVAEFRAPPEPSAVLDLGLVNGPPRARDAAPAGGAAPDRPEAPPRHDEPSTTDGEARPPSTGLPRNETLAELEARIRFLHGFDALLGYPRIRKQRLPGSE